MISAPSAAPLLDAALLVMPRGGAHHRRALLRVDRQPRQRLDGRGAGAGAPRHAGDRRPRESAREAAVAQEQDGPHRLITTWACSSLGRRVSEICVLYVSKI